MKKAIMYCRKSVTGKGKSDEENVAYQQARIREYAMKNELILVKEFYEVGVTGMIETRPELVRMYQYLEESKEEIGEILFYSIDRLGREILVNIDLLQKIVNKVGKATFIRENISTGAKDFNMFFLLYSGMAESARENLLRNLRDGRYAKVVRNGNFDGNYPPLGYMIDSSTKKLVAKENHTFNDELGKQELSIVENIFKSYLLGKSLRQIAKELNERFGYTKRGCEWNYKSVQYILKNPAYIGVLTGVLEKTEFYYREDSNIESLIDPVVFVLVQKKLEYETTGRKRKDNHQPVLMLCEFCGGILNYQNKKVICEKCDMTENEHMLIQILATELREHTKQKSKNEMSEKIRRNLILQYRIKAWKMESKLKELLKRKNQIQSMDVDYITKNNMLKVNTKLIIDLIKEKVIVEGIQCYFEKVKEQLKIEFSKIGNNLFQLPFIAVVDLVEKKVIILFLTNVMKKRIGNAK